MNVEDATDHIARVSEEDPAKHGAALELPERTDLERLFDLKHGSLESTGWGPRLRRRFDYYTPDDWYEALLDRLVKSSSTWLDVGCGRNLFPSNAKLARVLADRCRLLVGIDPDATLDDNPFVHERVRQSISDHHSERRYDLVTLRMVAEHIVDPRALVLRLAELTAVGGRVVIYTVHKWSPVPIVTACTPFSWHHRVKRMLWRTEAKDTFPTAFRMNTRGTLRRLFETGGFSEEHFQLLDDCRSLQRFRALNLLELASFRCLRAIGLHYPECCILGVYRRS